MPTIRCLAMLYSLAGVDCIDVAADPAVIAAARGGIQDARRLVPRLGLTDWAPADGQPWLMASLNDSEDPHFRKAYFEAAQCPRDCSRPCETVCPTAAIQFPAPARGGVVTDLCYGCGRCLPVCPIGHIEARCHQADSQALAQGQPVDALEIHTHIGQQESFTRLWNRLAPFIPKLKVVSVSCPGGPGLETYLRDLYRMMAPLPVPLIWQTDGRPMSGDIGDGTTRATILLAEQVLKARLPGAVQPALPGALGGVDELLADTGYCSEHNIERCRGLDIERLIALARESHHLPWQARFFGEPPDLGPDASTLATMAHRLKTRDGRDRCALRKQAVEPVFGIIKSVMGFRQFLLRGLENTQGEWSLVTMNWNIHMKSARR